MTTVEPSTPVSAAPARAAQVYGTVHERFAEVAARVPAGTAIACEDRQITYRGLDAWSDRIASDLRDRGLAPGQLVGLYAQRSPEALAAILGILKAGGAYVPFDPSYPHKLLRYIYEDSRPALMLVQRPLAGTGGEAAFWDGRALDLQAWPDADARPLAGGGLSMFVAPGDPAYVMYTSGSTGRPKGVLVPHRAVLRLVVDNDFARFGEDEVILHLAPLSFDASTFEIWAALLNGGTLAVVPEALPSLDDIAAAVVRHRATTLWLTAGLFHLMVDHRLDGLSPLRQLLAGGDVLSPPHVAKALAALPGCRIINGYGPTENTTFSCCYTIPREAAPGPIPIGSAIRHTETWVLDEARQPVADGEEGELYVGGAGLALGYLNRPDLTAERFLPHPFDKQPGARLYRTGDRVRRRADGNLEFVGRVDRQVKINGKRVELDEIEACLRRSGLVRDAAVIADDNGAGQRRIAAFVAPLQDQALALQPVREHLRRELPEYMLPAVLVALDALPLSPTGKVDRSRLAVPAATPPPAAPAATGGEIESQLLRIWRSVLNNPSIGVEQNFFDLGGTSLQLLRVHAEIRAALDCELSLVDLFRYPRISLLAAHLGQPEGAAGPAPLSARERAQRQSAALRNAPRRRTPR
jgi:amino acid adenylation domain-containing protein